MKSENKNFTAIIPAYNEANRFGHVVSELLKINELDELILVDDGSSDDTKKKAKKFSEDKRFIYIKHQKNKGKGEALKTGIENATSDIILFLDADLMNISKNKIKKIVDPVLNDEVDVSRGSFKLARGRVTEIAVKPMMKILFPDMYFDQPISGQVCAPKKFLQTVDLEEKWGVDIGILLDAIDAGLRIKEVDIGELEHKARPMAEKAEMAEQVLETMIKKAGLIHTKYKLVVFTLDDTLLKKEALPYLFNELGIKEKIRGPEELHKKSKLSFKRFINATSAEFKGIDVGDIASSLKDVPLTEYAKEVINSLKKRRVKVAIISSNFCPIVKTIAEELGVDFYDCIELEKKAGKITGRITNVSRKKWNQKNLEDALKKSFDRMLEHFDVSSEETMMIARSDKAIPLLKKAGMGIAYDPDLAKTKKAADKTIGVLAEILALIE